MTQPSFSSVRATIAVAAVAVLLLALDGCANSHPPGPSAAAAGAPASPDIYAPPSDQPDANVVRTGRYQLVPLAPTSGQRDLLRQAVSIDLPQSMHLTVRDGLQHVLRDSGLHLCPRQAQSGFFSSPLPAVHRELGPTTLSDALQVLVGPAWRLNVDFADRAICFAPRTASAAALDQSGASTTSARAVDSPNTSGDPYAKPMNATD